MGKFIKENWFKIGLLIISLVGIILVAYLNISFRKSILSSEQEKLSRNQEDVVLNQQKIDSELNQEPNLPVSTYAIESASDLDDPEKERNMLFLKEVNCQEIGKRRHQDLISSFGPFLVFNPSYKYHKRLNTCLYEGGFFGDDTADYMEQFVEDSLTNKYILSYVARRSNNGDFIRIDSLSNTLSIADFEAKKHILMSE